MLHSNGVEHPTFAEAFARASWRPAAARLVYETLADYYDAFSPCRRSLLESIEQQMEESASELGCWRAIVEGDELVGVYCSYSSEEEADRRFISLRMLLDVDEPAQDCFERLDAYRKTVGATPEQSHYLARIAVTRERRGMGVGRRLLEDFEEAGRRQGRPLAALHVHRDNRRAMDFYREAGYEVVSPAELSYATMTKSLVRSAA